MRRQWTILWIALVGVSWLSSQAQAEDWPTLEEFVADTELIVLATTVVEPDGRLTFAVDEAWLGTYDPSRMGQLADDDRFEASYGEHGVFVHDGQQIVFFFGPHNQPTPGLYTVHATAFPVVNGEITWASTSDFDAETMTVEEFRARIEAAAGM